MQKYFNITGSSDPEEHYMVNLDSRLTEIKKYVDSGKYFTINRGRQYGKTTTLEALAEYLKNEYIVINIDFQFLDTSDYASNAAFVSAFSKTLWSIKQCRENMSDSIQLRLKSLMTNDNSLMDMFFCFKRLVR